MSTSATGGRFGGGPQGPGSGPAGGDWKRTRANSAKTCKNRFYGQNYSRYRRPGPSTLLVSRVAPTAAAPPRPPPRPPPPLPARSLLALFAAPRRLAPPHSRPAPPPWSNFAVSPPPYAALTDTVPLFPAPFFLFLRFFFSPFSVFGLTEELLSSQSSPLSLGSDRLQGPGSPSSPQENYVKHKPLSLPWTKKGRFFLYPLCFFPSWDPYTFGRPNLDETSPRLPRPGNDEGFQRSIVSGEVCGTHNVFFHTSSGMGVLRVSGHSPGPTLWLLQSRRPLSAHLSFRPSLVATVNKFEILFSIVPPLQAQLFPVEGLLSATQNQ